MSSNTVSTESNATAVESGVAVHYVDAPFVSPVEPVVETVLLPRWFYILNMDKRYLSTQPGSEYHTITFANNPNCSFQALWWPTSKVYEFVADNGYSVSSKHGSERRWLYSNDSDRERFRMIKQYPEDNFIYVALKVQDFYWSGKQDDFGSPIVSKDMNEDSRFTIHQASVMEEIYDIKYDINGALITPLESITVLSDKLLNDSDVAIKKTLTYSYTKMVIGTWKNASGVMYGAKMMSFKAGVPFIDGEGKVSVSASSSQPWGATEGTSQLVTNTVTFSVPARKKGTVTIVVKRGYIQVGFKYTEKIEYANGKNEDTEKDGVYNNLDSYGEDVQLSDWEPIDTK